jgi:hypothetical protein
MRCALPLICDKIGELKSPRQRNPMLQFVRRLLLLCALGTAFALAGCAGISPTGTDNRAAPTTSTAIGYSLRLIGEATLPHRMDAFGTTLGGISGIDYDQARDQYYLLSDDRSDINAARFYTAKIALTSSNFSTPEITSVVTLKRPDGTPFGGKSVRANDIPDPEAIRYRADTDTLLWTSEGDKKLGIDPSVREMKLDGTFIRELPTLSQFKMKPDDTGPRDNLTFEGMSLTADGKGIWVSMEAALFEDGNESSVDKAGGPARFTLYHAQSGSPLRQLAYIPDAIPLRATEKGESDNGVPEILMLDAFRMLVLERSYSPGVGNSIRVYLIDTRDGSDVLNVASLKSGRYTPVSKRLLLNFDTLGLKKLDNTEAVSFGPRLPNGNRTLVFVSDDNFRKSQITQFLAFELTEPSSAPDWAFGHSLFWPYRYGALPPWTHPWPRTHRVRPTPKP